MPEGGQASPLDGATVCVTGATGYIALHLVEQLLQKGCHVKGTLRGMDDADKTAALTAFQQKVEKEGRGKLSPYHYSKVQAEKVGWRYSEESGIPLTTILPGLVIGPPNSRKPDTLSVEWGISLVEHGAFYKEILAPIVDVRETALAHIRAAERPNTDGKRYLLAGREFVPAGILASMAQQTVPEYAFEVPDNLDELQMTVAFDNTRSIEELGIEYRPLEESVRDAVLCLIELGIAKPTLKK
ncbi:unnamed protein product [Vitrella brassicaformis CCMP3155]|uniref:NAD-dependent epimerase/dehydratase domain-containing protein n=2 Tax=Vitrella brassicaformis TaxID=1169539 RepID=A0A0G4F7B2_VITBC|nr:unnamed protein product [Vitrella brassicaformis CCMP3155]|eukprot:CEM08602.1 unnamed protein product [Vitrella brassicaformis CCMP3155]